MMTVHELIEELLKLRPDTQVLISRDAEGNSFSPLSGFSKGYYFEETTWSGEFEEGSSNDNEDYDAIAFFPN